MNKIFSGSFGEAFHASVQDQTQGAQALIIPMRKSGKLHSGCGRQEEMELQTFCLEK